MQLVGDDLNWAKILPLRNAYNGTQHSSCEQAPSELSYGQVQLQLLASTAVDVSPLQAKAKLSRARGGLTRVQAYRSSTQTSTEGQ